MGRYINSEQDLYEMLDSWTHRISWDSFYSERTRPAPFLVQNSLPDESLVSWLQQLRVQNAVELGCGEGRNAVYLAKGIEVTAVDFSEVAIAQARLQAERAGVEAAFSAADVLKYDYGKKQYELVYDSGLFHSLAPHRRLQYLQLIRRLTAEGGYFGLVCFAWGEECREESVDDWLFYERRCAGQAFKKERLEMFF